MSFGKAAFLYDYDSKQKIPTSFAIVEKSTRICFIKGKHDDE